MKKQTIIIAVLISFALIVINSVNAQPSLQSQLTSLNLTPFLNKPIDSLIAKIPAGYTQLIVRGGGNMFLAGGIIVEYPDNFNIDISAHDFQYVTVRNTAFLKPALAWPINLMRKEKIECIIIYRNWLVINSAGE